MHFKVNKCSCFFTLNFTLLPLKLKGFNLDIPLQDLNIVLRKEVQAGCFALCERVSVWCGPQRKTFGVEIKPSPGPLTALKSGLEHPPQG